jgi:hypothetical protein
MGPVLCVRFPRCPVAISKRATLVMGFEQIIVSSSRHIHQLSLDLLLAHDRAIGKYVSDDDSKLVKRPRPTKRQRWQWSGSCSEHIMAIRYLFGLR